MYKKLIVLFLCAALLYPAPISLAAPQGGKVVGGNAHITQSGPQTTINQTSDKAIINWHSFDIGKKESVQHNMPSSNSAGLHRVVGGGGPSQIEGMLKSNGNVYLVNPAGVVIYNGAKIDVNGFIATSRDIANENFMKGNMVFDRPGNPGAAIINRGNITLKDNGLAVLVAPTVRNDGIIAGKLGKVALGGSEATWKLDMTGDNLIAFTLDESAVNSLHAADGTPLANVENTGKIKAEGGVVVLSAAQLDEIVGSVVNTGEISTASSNEAGGKITFRGQGNKVDLTNKGALDASSQTADSGVVRLSGQGAVVNTGEIAATGAKGGNVVLTGHDVSLKSGSSIDVSGANGGGTALIGGNARGKGPELNAKTTTVQNDAEILADAKLVGNGGQVVVWADEKTTFDGMISAKGGEEGGDGGFVETSAKMLIIGDPAIVNTSTKKGKSGTWLMDPEDFVIAAANGNISGETVSKNLESNDVQIDSYNGTSGGNGDIIINDEIEWSSDNILTLSAVNDIILNADITASGFNPKLYLFTNKPRGGDIIFTTGKINLSGAKPVLHINSTVYEVVNSLSTLQNIDVNRFSYALGLDIDAIETKDWNEGKGFLPIGKLAEGISTSFDHNFNGLGHSISNLYINRPEESNVGLFAWITPPDSWNNSINNLHLKDVTIIGKEKVGGLVGSFGIREDQINYKTTIDNVSVSGSITALNNIGGLIGVMVGGIVKKSFYAGNIEANGFTSATAGGLIGTIEGGTVDQTCTNGKVSGKTAGGLIGVASGLRPVAVSNTYTLAEVEGKIQLNDIGDSYGGVYVGGSIGQILGYVSVMNSYSSGRLSISKGSTHSDYIGGFIGSANGALSDTAIENCFWNANVSGVAVPVGFDTDPASKWSIIGLDEEEMRRQSSYPDWDFENVWKIADEKSYPVLKDVSSNFIQIPENPIEPEPIEPEPVDPTPIDPLPVDPTPVDPTPIDPTPSYPDPIVPGPSNPSPEYPSPSDPSTPKPIEPNPSQPIPPTVNPIEPTPSRPTPSNPIPSTPLPTPSKPGNSNTGSTQKPIYDGNDEYGGNFIYVDNLPASERQSFGFILPGTPVYVIDKEISSTKPDIYVVNLDKYNTDKTNVARLKDNIEGLCDSVTKKGTFDIATTALRIEIQKLFSMFFNTDFLLDSKKFSSNTMKAIKSVLENDHTKNLLKSNSYRLTVGYYLVLYSYIDEAVAALNKAESILETPVKYADSTNSYHSYMREAEKYMEAARQVYANEPQITALFNEFAIYETATTFAGALTDTIVDKIDSKLSKFLIPDAGVMTKSVEQSIKMQAKKEAKTPMKMKTLTAEDIWEESTSFTLPSSGAKNIFERNFNAIFG